MPPRDPRSLLRSFGKDRRGGFAVMAGTFMPVALILAAFAVDQGSLYVDRRNLQSLNDIAAITAAANINNATNAAVLVVRDNETSNVSVSTAGSVYNAAAHDTRQVDVTVERGRYTGKSNVAVASRFQAGVTPFNAVRVKLRKGGDLYFGKSLMDTPLISTGAIAHVPREAAFSIGSRLASINNGLLNQLLNSLLGTNISLSVMDYEALVRTDVSVFDFMSALATQLHLQAGTYNDVLDSNVSIKQIAAAMASVSGSNQTAKLAIQQIANTPANLAANIPLRQVIDLGNAGRLGIGEKPQGLNATVGLMELLQGSVAVANGKNQLATTINTGIPGLATVELKVAVGEPPQHSPFYAIAEPGMIVRTAQTRLKLTVRLLGGGTINASKGGLLGALIPVVLDVAAVELPLYIEIAHAEGRLTDVSCPTGRLESLSVSIAARPGIATLHVGRIDETQLKNFSVAQVPDWARIATLKLLGLDLLSVQGKATVAIQNISETTLTFNKAEIDAKAVKTVSTQNILQPLTQSLLNTLQVRLVVVGILPLGFVEPSLTTVKSTLVGLLTPIASPVDALLYSTLSTLGVRVGEADVRIHGATCGRSVLVQ